METSQILYSLKRNIGETDIVVEALVSCAHKQNLSPVNITVLLNQAMTHIESALSDVAKLLKIKQNGVG
jgi:hypothetical protein